MENLKEILKTSGYKSISFKIASTQHLFIRAKVNGVLGDFIVDTGASNSCIDFEHIDMFSLTPKDSSTKASGAGSNGLFTQVTFQNALQIGRWKQADFNFVLLDLSHVNRALTEYKTKNVHGIIGSDVLKLGDAIINYKDKVLYMK